MKKPLHLNGFKKNRMAMLVVVFFMFLFSVQSNDLAFIDQGIEEQEQLGNVNETSTELVILGDSFKKKKLPDFYSDKHIMSIDKKSFEGYRSQIEHLIFIDTSLPDYEILEANVDLKNSAIVFLNPNNNEGILKMTQEIQKYNGLESIHIVGHAKPAELILGSDSFWMDDLNMIKSELDSWKSHVSTNADLFLYGCSLAETVKGKQMVDLMASLTGMDVTASTDLTGHASKNADWELEYKTGTIESQIAFSEHVRGYAHTLQSLNFEDLRTFEEVNEGSGGDGHWTYPENTGRTAYQSRNTSNPVYLLSPDSGYIDEVFKGTITVDAGAGDDDDIGFAFGFNGVNDTYIWSWDMGGISMGVRSGGAHLLFKKTAAMSWSSVSGTLIGQGPNNDPWQHGVTYQIEILYTANRIRVRVNGIEKFDVSAAEAGVAQFPAGRFGFYNYSQGNVTFGNIQKASATDDPIPPSAQDDSYGMEPNTTLNVDFLDGILKNDYDANLDEFTIVQVSNVSHGSLSLNTNDGSFTYTPTAGYEGADQFTYKLVQDSDGAESAVRTVTFGIIASNQAPTDIQLSNTSISEGAVDNTNIGTLTTTDGNNPNDQHDYSLSNNGGGRFTVNGNSLIVANSSLLTPGDYVVTVRSTDLMGEFHEKNFTISVISNAKPTSANGQIQLDSGSNYLFGSNDFSFTDTDGDTFGGIRIETIETAGDLEYDGSDVFDGTVVNDITLLNFKAPSNASGNPYSTFTFKVFDSRGGISTDAYTMSIRVSDDTDPIAIAQNVTVQLDASGNGSTTAALVDNGSNDASGIASLSLSQTDFNCSNIANNPNIVTLTVTDNNGNVSTTTAEVTVTDELNPTVIARDITVQLDETGNASITASQIDNGSTDNCGIASYGLDTTTFTCADVGSNTVTLTVTDVNGNSGTATATVTVEDNVDPTVVVRDITVQLDATGNASITASQIDNGSTDNCGIASYGLDTTTFTCADVGSNTVTLTVTDVNGNSGTATANVSVEDNVDPTVVARDITVQLDTTGNASITAAEIDNGSNDNCGIASYGLDTNAFTCADVGSNTVTLTVTDVNGNSGTATATVTVEDNVDPTVVARDITVQLDATGNASITASQIDNGSTDNCGIASYGLDTNAFTCADVGSNTVTLTVTDVNGNSGTATATVTVEDNVDPTVVARDITVQLDVTGNASITASQIDNGSTDNCGIASYGLDTTAFTCADVGSNTVTLTVTDVNGNSGTATATVTVEDNVDPTVVARDITVQLDATGNASITASQIDNGSTDNCGIASYGLDTNAFTCADVGSNTVTLTVTDVNGNSGTATANVSVEDNVDPTVVARDITVQLDATGNASITASQIDNGSTDNCGIASYGLDTNAFTCADVGSNTVTLTVTDVNGNSGTATATVTVEDNVDPTVVARDITVQLDVTGNASITASQIDNGSTDNCGIASYGLDTNAFTCADVGSNTVTLTVTDVNGNSGTATAIITVEDMISPTVVTQNLTLPLDANGFLSITAEDFIDESSDNCGISEINADRTDFNCSVLGDYTITLTIMDSNGNVTIETAILTLTGEDNDGDLIADPCDTDDDNDGLPDSEDSFPFSSEPKIVPAEAFTPNGDGINESWVIPGIDNYPNNTVKVFNRWGHVVFSTKSYRNNWEGFYKNNNEKLPAGSYMYMIDLGDGSAPIQGWIYINY